jgi:hypothetical protein
MPRVDEILDALKLARSVGQLPFGHFDHDADCAIGPYLVADPAKSDEELKTEEDPTAVVYERFEDPRTGEPLYRPVKKSSEKR